ncbi:hypothetical protein CVM73_32095 [Bradyrhizobium forestalis]|uniref:Uncharacterized protein n=1 Tax=Bradyrhizobium forestalis TaxID=1419263 RepID=A0A2M8R0B3_9BRAD|nr:hypothetical protein [Bradyrhizobium forestalis]PJG51259.1 hypothetical protein CVM73_32095 [Bradyrhizobium forestalis]
MADEKPNGLFITDDAGNVYYLRPEILAQTKMPEEDVKKLREEVAANSKGQAKDAELSIDDLNAVAGGVSFPTASHVHLATNISSHTAAISSAKLDLGKVATSTVMCPW